MTENDAEIDAAQLQLARLFAYKAEWLQQDLFDLFREPNYFPELATTQSCVLIGGRGSGKTTALRGLSYEGQRRLRHDAAENWPYYGLYYKVDSNKVSALSGLGKADQDWQRPFAHYLNLIISDLGLRFLNWYQLNRNNRDELITLTDKAWRKFERTLSLQECPDVDSLSDEIDRSMNDFELYVNTVHDADKIRLSAQGSPIDRLFEALDTVEGLSQKMFFILVDEFESLADYQQRIFNSLLKQSAGQSYCFKIGVRELGWRARTTLNGQELRAPSDYRRIEIAERLNLSNFRRFARHVCNDRLERLTLTDDASDSISIERLLPSLSLADEAGRLGLTRQLRDLLSDHSSLAADPEMNELLQENPLMAWFIFRWCEHKGDDPRVAVKDYIDHPAGWETRFENHIYAYLFTLRGDRRGLRKLYCGWETFTVLAAGNIRFLLQLVEFALRQHLRDRRDLLTPISPDVQTRAAMEVGEDNLKELEGVDWEGSPVGQRIVRLVMGFGRIFGLLAARPFGHAPEVNQFWFAETQTSHESTSAKAEAERLLKACIMHLALVRTPSNKLAHTDPLGYDYALHPIFSPYFQYSHRRKRKLRMSALEILELVENQGAVLEKIIKRHNRYHDDSGIDRVDRRDQLGLF